MKHKIESLLLSAIQTLKDQDVVPPEATVSVQVEHSRDKQHGDFASNVALVLSKAARRKPRELAQALVEALPTAAAISKVEIAGPGFINFFLSPTAYHETVRNVLQAGSTYGRSTLGMGKRVQVEFVSANPTGPLHVGHGRGAAYGAAVADLLEAAGYSVHREYYINDAGRQMDILAASVWLRYLQSLGEVLDFPVNGYKGDYVRTISDSLREIHGKSLCHPATLVTASLPPDEPAGGNKEEHIDAIVERTKALLGAEQYRAVFDLGLGMILEDIREDLQEFGVTYEQWYSERTLDQSGAVDKFIDRLKGSGHVYEKDAALWFRSTDYGDEKDRVVVRDNGQRTYFASDIAYHADKIERGFDLIVDVWGADHHGYVPRVKAALTAIGDNPERLQVLLVQFAVLYRGGEKVQMSTRSGEFVTLRELRKEVGNDAARFFYVMRKSEQHLDFDLDLAKSRSNDNPVYYIQYAHARICSVFRQLAEKNLAWDAPDGDSGLHLLHESHEQDLMAMLARYPEVIESAARAFEPHQIAHYLRELAHAFHTYYNSHTFIVDESALRNARLSLIAATRHVLCNGLTLLGVSAPESM